MTETDVAENSFYTGTVRDATERQQYERQLRQAKDVAIDGSRAKSHFLASMSHELRTPMNAIIGYSEMLQEEFEDEGQQQFIPDLQKIHAAGRHLLSLINEILDLSKIEAGKVELFVESFDVHKLIEDVCITVEPLVAQKSNQLHVEVADELGSMQGDQTKVRQILFNLLSNASKFTKGGKITLSAKKAHRAGSEFVEFQVSDSGIGMTQEQMDRIFESFTQADASTTREFGGTGLGLTISKEFVRMMDGSIDVTSTEGEGSTFTVLIPTELESSLDQSGGERPSVTDAASHTVVLAIDDDQEVHDLLRRMLTKRGFELVSAMDGKSGIELAKAIRPTAITLDVMMPGMDGWAVLRALKSDDETADIPVVMLSIVDEQAMGFALGVSDYLTKPVDRTRLLAILNRHRCDDPPCPVLIVEDDPAVRQVLSRLLHKEGWEVDEAENGRVGLQRVAEHQPELIILDLLMPEMDGFQFVRELRLHHEWRTIPIVVLTSKDLTDEDRRELNGTVQAVIPKSKMSNDELIREIHDLVAICNQGN